MTAAAKSQHPCVAGTMSGRYSGPCGNPASVERGGKWYCKRHDPATEKERFDRQQARSEARRAAAPEHPMAEVQRLRRANEALVAALKLALTYMPDGAYAEGARAALALAKVKS